MADKPIWSLESKGLYSVKSMYKMINWGGMVSIWRDYIWKIKVPPNIHVFLWLIVHNKSLTRDNLAKRQHVEDLTCVFCCEPESLQHLFFYCVVARQVWLVIANCTKMPVPNSFESLLPFWKKKKSFDAVNLISAATLWSLWLFRNEIVFQGRRWRSIKCVLEMVGRHIYQWKIMCVKSQAVLLLQCLKLLDHHRGELLRIAWHVDAPVGIS